MKTIGFLKKPAISRLTNTSARKLTVKWGINTKADGYQITYSLKKNFSSAKTVNVSGASTVSNVISNLKKGKTYYVKMRSYMTVDNVNYYSVYSSAKHLKIVK